MSIADTTRVAIPISSLLLRQVAKKRIIDERDNGGGDNRDYISITCASL